MNEGLRMGMVIFLLNAPHYLLCCVPFYPQLRVRRSVLYLGIVVTALLMAVYYGLRATVMPYLGDYHDLIMVAFYLCYLLQYKRYFDISLPKLLYIFFFAQAYSTVLNVLGKFVDVRFFPDHIAQIGATSYALIVLLMMALTYPLLFRFFRGKLRRAFDQLPSHSFWLLCLTPALFYLINTLYGAILYGQMAAERPSFDQTVFVIFILLAATGLITYVVTLNTALDAAKRARLESDMAGMERQLTLQAQGYEQLTENIERMRAARHDLRHHLSVMTAYVEKGDREGLEEYLEDYRRSVPDEAEPPVCENYAVDVVVRHYLAQAAQAGARLDVKLALPMNAGVPDADLCIVFGNLFENAALAVARQSAGDKFIAARCSCGDGRIVLTVDNSTGPTPPGRGGVGQASVRAVAQRYAGSARFEWNAGVYQSSVLLSIQISTLG